MCNKKSATEVSRLELDYAFISRAGQTPRSTRLMPKASYVPQHFSHYSRDRKGRAHQSRLSSRTGRAVKQGYTGIGLLEGWMMTTDDALQSVALPGLILAIVMAHRPLA